MRFLGGITLLAGLAGAHSLQADGALAGQSPFTGTAAAAAARPAATELFRLTGVTAMDAVVRLCVYDTSAQHSRWIAVGSRLDGIEALSYDPARKQAIIAVAGVRHTLDLREWETAVLAPVTPEARARDARLLTGDLLDIGLQQRQAYAASHPAAK